MANEAIKKVLANVAQNLTSEEKRQARDNIGAAASADVVTDSVRYSEQTPTVAEQAQARTNIGAVSGLEVNNAITQALEGLAHIAFTGSWTDLVNVPTNLVYDASYVHTDNNFTTSEKNKLSGIEAGAEVNVQSDWNQTDNTKDDYIKNKPNNLVQDASYVHTDNNFTNSDKNKLDGIAAGAEVNVQSDWNQSDSTKDDYIKNKPNIDYTNWNEDGSLEFDQENRKIRVHPNMTVVSSTVYSDYTGTWAKVASFPAMAQSSINHRMTHLEIEVTDYFNTYSGLFVVDIYFDQTSSPEANGYWVYAAGNSTSGRIKKMHLYTKGGSSSREYELWVELKDYIPYYKFISFKATKNVMCSNHRTSSNGHIFYPDWWNFEGMTHTVANAPSSGTWTEVTLTHAEPGDNGIQRAIDGANVQSDWTASSGAAVILNKPQIGFKAYGAQSVTEATSLVVDGDEPTGITDIKVNNDSKGILISGPYKTLLDSGIAGSKGDADHGIYIDTNGVFQACTNAVLFKCTLSTTFAELEAAITAGKIPFLVTASKVIPMCRYSSGTSAWFTDVTMWGNLLTVGAHSYALTASGWAEYPKSMNTNEDIHLPSCVTAKATIAVQDAYAEWMRVGTLIIGGRGNSGGTVSIGVKSSVSGSNAYITDSIFRTTNTNASGAQDNVFEVASVTVASAQWNTLRTIDQYSGTATVNCTYDINMFDTLSTNPSHYNIKIHKLFDGQYSRVYMSATESWGSMD